MYIGVSNKSSEHFIFIGRIHCTSWVYKTQGGDVNKMAKLYTEIPQKLQQFIKDQKIFFVATATADGRINLSPKGMDSLRVLDANRVAWLNVTGSGNETAAHVQENPRMTLMFTAFQDNPMIPPPLWDCKGCPQKRC